MEGFPAAYLDIEDKAGNPYKDENFKGYTMRDEDSTRSSGRRQGRGGRPQGDGPHHKERSEGRRLEQKPAAQGAQKAKTPKDREKHPRPAPSERQQKGNVQVHGRQIEKNQRGEKARQNKTRIQGPRDGQPTKIILPKQKEVIPTSLGGLFKRILYVLFPWLRKK